MMSFDIYRFQVKRMEEFRINIEDIKSELAKLFDPDKYLSISDTSIILMSNTQIQGKVIDGWIYPDQNGMWVEDDWSGTMWRDVLKPAIKKGSKGVLEAVLIWENAERTQRVSIKDGIITETEIVL